MAGDPDDADSMSAPPSLADSFERLLAEPADAFATPLTAGTVVAGRYEVIERIGAGAMGMVYLAKDRDLERKIALKLHKKRAGTEQLRREALAMARLAHPNVVTVFEVGEHEGRTFVAMEYVAGTTLRGWLAAEKRTPAEILDMLVVAGEGLVAAHDAKLVHRDFKPENVLIGSDGRARVSDFGLARESGHEVGSAAVAGTQSTGVAGTPAYMAPEQALGISVDARADQYAFCGVAWEALVGAWPRDDKATKNPRIRRVLERGLAKDPSARYPTMRALLAALRGARSRGHLVAGAIAIALLVVAAAVAFAWPDAKRDAVDCDGAGIAITTLGLDIPARIAMTNSHAVAANAEARLARYRASFAAAASKVCRNALVDHTWSRELYERGTQCLTLRRRIVERLFTWTPEHRISAPELIDRVVRLETETECADATILASTPRIATDPARVDQVIAARVAIESAASNYDSDRTRGLDEVIAAIEASSIREEPTIAARLEMVRGIAAADRGRIVDSEAHLAKAYYAARAIDDPTVSLSTVTALLSSADSRYDDAAVANWLGNALADANRSRLRAPSYAGRTYVIAATVMDGHGDAAKALEYINEGIDLLGEKPSRSLADALLVRASIQISAGKPDAAIADYRRSLEMFEGQYGPNHPTLARAKLTASAGFTALGKRDDAVKLATEGRTILERNPGLTSRDVAQIKLNLGVAYINSRDYDMARKYLGEARTALIAMYGPEHPDLALVQANFAHIAVDERHYDVAAKLARETLALMERTTPKPHEDRGQVLLTLADAARGMNDHETAIDAAVKSAAEYPVGDERKILSLVVAAMVANDAKQGARALELVEQAKALPAPTEPQLIGRLQYEYGRGIAKKDRAAAIKAIDAAIQVFRDAELTSWADEAKDARREL